MSRIPSGDGGSPAPVTRIVIAGGGFGSAAWRDTWSVSTTAGRTWRSSW